MMLKVFKIFQILLLLIILLAPILGTSQNKETITYDNLELTQVIDGNLDLFWTLDQHHYRYFIRTSTEVIIELKNNHIKGHKYDEAYKNTLKEYTQPSEKEIKKLKFTLFHLSEFIDKKNAEADPNYMSQSERAEIILKGSLLGGITNLPYIENPENAILPQFGIELEMTDEGNFPRHALYFQIRQILKSDKLNYQNTELAIGYRYKLIRRESFNLYANLTFATLGFVKGESVYYDENDQLIEEDINQTDFETPFGLGIGVDIKVSKNGYFTIQYNELVGILTDNLGSFSTNILVGYKFKF